MQDKSSAAQDPRITGRQGSVQILPLQYFIVSEALVNGIISFSDILLLVSRNATGFLGRNLKCAKLNHLYSLSLVYFLLKNEMANIPLL